MVTQKDIALKLGLSPSAVSRALNPTPDKHSTLSEDTAEHVRKVAREMGFRPNRSASFLRKGKTAAFGVFLPAYKNSLMANLIMGINAVTAEENFPLNFYFCNSGMADYRREREQSFISFMETMNDLSYSGIISYPFMFKNSLIPDILKRYHKEGGHAVLLNAHSEDSREGWFDDWPVVTLDDYHGGAIAADRLMDVGTKTFVALNQITSEYTAMRTRGFEDTLVQHGKAARILQVPSWSAMLLSDLRRIMNPFLTDKSLWPLGLFAESDQVAMQIIRLVDNYDIKIGSDVLMIGYNDNMTSEFTNPPLTTIHQPFYEQGKLVMRKLVNMVNGGHEESEQLKPWLVVRDSG